MALRRTVIAAPLLLAGCVHMLPPPPTPGPVQPPRFEAPIPPGLGRIYIDVVDGPTDVREVQWVSEQVTLNDLVYEDSVLDTLQRCRTPCILDLPVGHRLLAFPMRGSVQAEVDDVTASPIPSLYRRALGSRRRGGALSVLGILGATFGGCSFATGAALLPVGLATDKSGLTISGSITVGVGAVLIALGVWAMAANPTFEQPGAGAQYPLEP